MKKTLIFTLIASSLLAVSTSFAQTISTTVTSDPSLISWSSKDANDVVTIQNGAGTPMVIEISVNNGGLTAAGITIKNCGTTAEVKAGSSAVCTTADAKNPVSFSNSSMMASGATSKNPIATGSYKIKQVVNNPAVQY